LVYGAQEKDKLVTERIYSYMRHPQYTGIFLTLFGQLIHWPTLPTLALFPFIVWMYIHLTKKEEKAMLDKFGREYEIYMQHVPKFFPKFANLGKVLPGG
jgi:protein-S-isoprenylcysteine O-methyltransferase Ste14